MTKVAETLVSVVFEMHSPADGVLTVAFVDGMCARRPGDVWWSTEIG